jgi:hypothetical protein
MSFLKRKRSISFRIRKFWGKRVPLLDQVLSHFPPTSSRFLVGFLVLSFYSFLWIGWHTLLLICSTPLLECEILVANDGGKEGSEGEESKKKKLT